MNGFSVLLQKEWREHTRNFKMLWIPLVFIIFGIMEPITNHFLPEIMKSVGNMPEGAEFLWPEFKGEDIFHVIAWAISIHWYSRYHSCFHGDDFRRTEKWNGNITICSPDVISKLLFK